MDYQHTQTSLPMWLIAALGVSMLVVGLTGFVGADRAWYLVAAALLISTGAGISRLTVVVDDTHVTVTFGWGWPRRRIELGEIASAGPVRNSWWHGWGIRKVRDGWMFNNAGRDAVELRLRSGKVFRVGTDQPGDLFAAIERARRAS